MTPYCRKFITGHSSCSHNNVIKSVELYDDNKGINFYQTKSYNSWANKNNLPKQRNTKLLLNIKKPPYLTKLDGSINR